MIPEERPKREPSRWFLNNVSDEVVRCIKATRIQMKREMPTWATEDDYVLAHLFVAHELLAECWQPVSRLGQKTTSYKLAEAMADISQVLIDLTGRSEDEISGKREIERRKQRLQGP